jgi:histone H3/H4
MSRNHHFLHFMGKTLRAPASRTLTKTGGSRAKAVAAGGRRYATAVRHQPLPPGVVPERLKDPACKRLAKKAGFTVIEQAACDTIRAMADAKLVPIVEDLLAIATYTRHRTLLLSDMDYVLRRAAERGHLPRFAGQATL